MAQQKSMKGKYKYVTDSKGTRHRIPVDKNGKVPFKYLEEFASQKSPVSQKLDKMKVSNTVYPSQPEPILAYQWMKHTGSSDISGLDSPQGTRINYSEPKKYKAKRKKNGTAKKTAPKAQSKPKAAPVQTQPANPPIFTGSVGLIPLNMREKLDGMQYTIVETKDGKVVLIEETCDEPLDDPKSVGAVNYYITDHGNEFDGGLMEYRKRGKMKDLERYIGEGMQPDVKDGLKFKRIVARSPSDDYEELSEAVFLAMAGERETYDSIKAKYALANKKPTPGTLKHKLTTRLRR